MVPLPQRQVAATGLSRRGIQEPCHGWPLSLGTNGLSRTPQVSATSPHRIGSTIVQIGKCSSRPGEVPAAGRGLARRFIRLRGAAPTVFAGSHQALLASTGTGIRSSNVVLGQLTKPAFGSDASLKLGKQGDDRLERGELSHFLSPDVLLPPDVTTPRKPRWSLAPRQAVRRPPSAT